MLVDNPNYDDVDASLKPKPQALSQVRQLIRGWRANSWFITVKDKFMYIYKLDQTREPRDLSPAEERQYDADLTRIISELPKKKTTLESEKFEHHHAKDESGERRNYVKIIQVTPNRDDFKEIPRYKLPLMIASLGANFQYNQKTCARITTRVQREALMKAIYGVEFKIAIERKNEHKILDYLSPLEYETLIAKIFEEKHFYVSTFRGGAIPFLDLEIKNTGPSDLLFGSKNIPRGAWVVLQIKQKRLSQKEADIIKKMYLDWFPDNDVEPAFRDFRIVCQEKNPRITDASIVTNKDLIPLINELPQVRNWLRIVLDWVDDVNELIPNR